MKLKIGKKQYILKYNVRTLILYERITDKPFSIEGITEWAVLTYSALLAGTPGADIDLEEFLDDLTPDELTAAIDWLMKQLKIDRQVNGEKEESGEVKKK